MYMGQSVIRNSVFRLMRHLVSQSESQVRKHLCECNSWHLCTVQRMRTCGGCLFYIGLFLREVLSWTWYKYEPLYHIAHVYG